MEETKRRLILHFDLNRTLIMRDENSTVGSEEGVLADIISEMAWGRIEQKEKDEEISHVWVCASDALSPASQGGNCITYKNFLLKEFAMKGEEEPNEVAREQFNKEQEKKIAEKIREFMSPGNPGAKFKKSLEKMLSKLELPAHVKEQLGTSAEQPSSGGAKTDDYLSLLKGGRYHLIPSFFALIRALKKAKREFAIIFRSFDADIKPAIAEFNALCEGTHACFNGVAPNSLVKMDGSEEGKDYRISTNKGILYRFDALDNTAMIIGTFEKADNKEELDDFYSGGLEEDTLSLLYGVQDIYVNLVESVQQVCSYAIQDDYGYWLSKERSAEAGKLLFVDEADSEMQQIFFDDGISDSAAYGSVDLRDLVTGETLPYKKAINKYFVRVEPDKAILDIDYFIKKVEECERRRTEELENLDKGLTSKENSLPEQDVNEWEMLKHLGTTDYLVRTVLPVVYQGLTEIDIERPLDPVKTFAFFLLKNQNLVKLPEKPVELEKHEGSDQGSDQGKEEQENE